MVIYRPNLKPIFKEKMITIRVAYCPKCGNELKTVTNPDAMTIMTYHCNKCHWAY
jgi:hypothetical protein